MSEDFDPTLLMHAMAAQTLPGFFKESFTKQHPDYILANGYGSGYANARREIEERQFNETRKTAVASDASKAASTITGMFITAATASGKKLTSEEIARINATAKKQGANLETYLSLARGLGFTDTAINSLRRMFYGDKGSTAHMFDSVYNQMRSKVGSGAALNLAKDLAGGRYGKYYSAEMSGNMNADDFAETFTMMASSGHFAGENMSSGGRNGFALIDDRGISNAVSDMSAGESLSGRLDDYLHKNLQGDSLSARNYRRAVSMMADQYTDTLKTQSFDDRIKSLGSVFDGMNEKDSLKDAKTAMERVSKLNKQLSKVKEKYRVSVNTTEKDVDKGVKDLEKQFNDKIKEAKKNKDAEAEKQLNEAREATISAYKEAMQDTTVKTADGKSMNSFEVVSSSSVNNELARKKILQKETEYTAIKGKLEYIKQRRYELATGTGAPRKPGETDESLRRQEVNAEQAMQRFRDTDDAARIVYESHGSAELQHRMAAVNDIAKSVQKVFAASGKPITQAEAMQATKGLVSAGDSTEAVRAISDVIKTASYGTMSRNGSPEQMLLQLNSGMDIAKSYGIKGVEAVLLSNVGLNSNATSASRNLSDAEARRVADENVKTAAKKSKYGRIAVLAAGTLKNSMAMTPEEEAANPDKWKNSKLGSYITQLRESDPKVADDLLKAFHAANRGEATEEQLRLIDEHAHKGGLWTSADERSDSTLMKRYMPENKKAYERTVNQAAADETVRKFRINSGMSGAFIDLNNKIKAAGGQEITFDKGRATQLSKFLLDNNTEFSKIMNIADDKKRQTELLSFIQNSNLDPEFKKQLEAQYKQDGGLALDAAFRRINDRGNLDKYSNEYAAQKEQERVARDNAIERRIGGLFADTDKNGLQDVMKMASSEEFKSMSAKEKKEALAKAYTTPLTTLQKQALAWDMARQGTLTAGKYKVGRQTIKLSTGEIKAARLKLNEPDKFNKLIEDAKRAGKSTVTIDGETISIATAEHATEQVLKVGGSTLGMQLSDKQLAEMSQADYIENLSDEQIAESNRHSERYKEISRRSELAKRGATFYKRAGAYRAGYDNKSDDEKAKIDQEEADLMAQDQAEIQKWLSAPVKDGEEPHTLANFDSSKLKSAAGKSGALTGKDAKGKATKEEVLLDDKGELKQAKTDDEAGFNQSAVLAEFSKDAKKERTWGEFGWSLIGMGPNLEAVDTAMVERVRRGEGTEEEKRHVADIQAKYEKRQKEIDEAIDKSITDEKNPEVMAAMKTVEAIEKMDAHLVQVLGALDTTKTAK